MKDNKKYQITILGETIRLLSDESDEYIGEITNYIEDLLKFLNKTGASLDMPSTTKFLYCAVFLTDELLKERKQTDELKERLRLSEIDLHMAKKELEDFILSFDK